ncbi:MAG: hypothetical protein AABX91_01955 [Nanoarchaeota archaeon]
MNKNVKFFLLELLVLGVMGAITLIEIPNFGIFEKSFTYIKTPASWFVGLSLAYAFSNLFQKGMFSIFSRKAKEEGKEKGDFFEGFFVTLLITSLITPYIKDAAIFFFSDFFIYFHVILLQSVIILYLLFKLKNNYEISGKYFVTNELIVLFYTTVILYFVV